MQIIEIMATPPANRQTAPFCDWKKLVFRLFLCVISIVTLADDGGYLVVKDRARMTTQPIYLSSWPIQRILAHESIPLRKSSMAMAAPFLIIRMYDDSQKLGVGPIFRAIAKHRFKMVADKIDLLMGVVGFNPCPKPHRERLSTMFFSRPRYRARSS